MIMWYGGIAYNVSTWAWAAVLAFLGMGAQWGDGSSGCSADYQGTGECWE